MGFMSDLDNHLEDVLLGLHTAFVGKVVKTDGKTAAVQPLHLMRDLGGVEEKRALIDDVPILQTVKKFKIEKRMCGGETPRDHIQLVDVAAEDVVFCLCGERDITDAKDGKFHLPTERHSIKDAVIIGVF